MQKGWVFPYDRVKRGSRIILYGAGKIGHELKKQLDATGYCEIVIWVDTNYQNFEEKAGICSPSQIAEREFDQILIAINSKNAVRSILSLLYEMGIPDSKIVTLCDLWKQKEEFPTEYENRTPEQKCDHAQKGNLSSPPNLNHLNIAFIIPEPIKGGGGHRNIFRAVRYLHEFGHKITVYLFRTSASAEESKNNVSEWFYPMRDIAFVSYEGELGYHDAGIATWWETAYVLKEQEHHFRSLFYFVQDFEPYFYPVSSSYYLAENTYKLGLSHICSGPWVNTMLKEKYSVESEYFQFPLDRAIYHAGYQRDKKNKNIIFFAKPEMPRRCFEIGMEGLTIFKRRHPEIEIILFGSNELTGEMVPFEATILNYIPTLWDMAQLYVNADLGIVFSTTNPSLVPYEMMSCGCPVVDLDLEFALAKYGNDTDHVFLLDPLPDKFAAGLEEIFANEALLWKKSMSGYNWVRKEFPTEEEMARLVETYIRNKFKYGVMRCSDISFKDQDEMITDKVRSDLYRTVIINVFGTAVLTPWNKAKDMYFLLDDLFAKMTDSNLVFHELRSRYDRYEDLTIHDIYDALCCQSHISTFSGDKLKERECQLLLNFCKPREFVKALYFKAQSSAKEIIFSFSGPLDLETVQMVLEKCGYTGDYRLFHENDLKHLMKKEQWKKNVLYLGCQNSFHNSVADHVMIPDTIDVLCGEYDMGILCEKAVWIATGNTVSYDRMKNNAGIGIMRKMVANRFFDNPFVDWRKDSLFNADPYFTGYYTLGMHLAGIVKWIVEEAGIHKYRRILFCSRDGFLVKRAYDSYRKIVPQLPESLYIQASRKALLPALLKTEADFFMPPGVFYDQYSPRLAMLLFWEFTTMAQAYEFRQETYPQYEEKCRAELENVQLEYDKNFESIEKFEHFVTFFLAHYYSKEKHEHLREAVRSYYKEFSEGDALFDLGYSGRLAKEVAELSSGVSDVLYLYTDEETSEYMRRKGNFRISSFYSYTPNVDNAIREYIISENGPTCLGFSWEHGRAVPVFEMRLEEHCESEAIDRMQKGALDFISDLYGAFGMDIERIPFKGQEASLPFEGFLRDINKADLEMFSDTYQEDYYTGKPMPYHWGMYYRRLMSHLPEVSISWSRGTSLYMNLYKHAKRLAYFGTGAVYRRIRRQFYDVCPVLLLDNHPEPMQDNLSVMKPEHVSCLQEYFIVITADCYKQMAEQLERYGLQKYKDYVWYKEII